MAGGKFPITSRKVNKYVILTTYKGYLHVEPMPNLEDNSVFNAFDSTFNLFIMLGRKSQYHRMDGASSVAIEQYIITKPKVTVQYAPPTNHRTLQTERGIQTFKNHFISGSGHVDQEFPMFLWGEPLEQCEITMNSMIPYKPDPNISACHGIYRKPFDFKAHPVQRPGIKMLVFDPPDPREAWAPHGTEGFYIGPALKHCRCYRAWIPTTKAIRIADTAFFFPNPSTSRF